MVSTDVLENSWYVRMTGSVEAVKGAFGEVSFLARSGAPEGEIAFLTAPMSEPALNGKLAGLGEAQSVLRVL